MSVDEIIAALSGLTDADELPQEIADAIVDLSDEDYDKVYAAIPEGEKVEVSDVNGDGDKDTVTVDVDGDGTVDKATVAADSKKEADEGLKEVAKKAEPKTEKDGTNIKPEVEASSKHKAPKDFGIYKDQTDALINAANEYEKEFGVKPDLGLQPMNRNIVSALRDLIL